MTPKKLMASGEGGPNPAGWKKLTPEQVRLAIAFRIDDMSSFADFTWTERKIGTLIKANAEVCQLDLRETQGTRCRSCIGRLWSRGGCTRRQQHRGQKSQKNGARIFMAEQCMMIPGQFDMNDSLDDEVP